MRQVQHRQEREERKLTAQNRELRQKVKELERTAARQQKLIDKLQNELGAACGDAEPGTPQPPPSRGARTAGPFPAAVDHAKECGCEEPNIRDWTFGDRNFRICRNCKWRKRIVG